MYVVSILLPQRNEMLHIASTGFMQAYIPEGIYVHQVLAFHAPHPHLQGLGRASARCGLCQASMLSGEVVSRRTALQSIALLPLAVLPFAAAAKSKKVPVPAPVAEKIATMSLDEFYAVLEDQEVLKVEFDGAKFEVCPLKTLATRCCTLQHGLSHISRWGGSPKLPLATRVGPFINGFFRVV